MTEVERNRLAQQKEVIEELRRKYPVSPSGPYVDRIFTEKEMVEMAQRAKNITGFLKREKDLKYYQGMLPGEHIRVR